MKIKFWIPVTILVLGWGLTACNSQDKEQRNKETILWYEMMAIHDEVMPKTSEISRLSRNLSKMKDDVPSIFESEYNLALTNLEKADEGMKTWMVELQQLEEMRKTKSHEEIMAYLNGEMKKIERVKKDMLSSIGAAEFTKVRLERRIRTNNN